MHIASIKARFRKALKRYTVESYKILKNAFFKSVSEYDIIHSCIKYEVICW